MRIVLASPGPCFRCGIVWPLLRRCPRVWMLIVVCAGSTWGAVNKPVVSIVPQAAPLQLGPETLQITGRIARAGNGGGELPPGPEENRRRGWYDAYADAKGRGAGTIEPPPPHPSVRAPQARIAVAWRTAKRTLVRPAYCLFATQYTRGPASKDWATAQWLARFDGKADEFARFSEQLGLLKT